MLKELLKHLLDCRSKDLKLVTDATVNYLTNKITFILKKCTHTLKSQNKCAELIAAIRLRVKIYFYFIGYFWNM